MCAIKFLSEEQFNILYNFIYEKNVVLYKKKTIGYKIQMLNKKKKNQLDRYYWEITPQIKKLHDLSFCAITFVLDKLLTILCVFNYEK